MCNMFPHLLQLPHIVSTMLMTCVGYIERDVELQLSSLTAFPILSSSSGQGG